MTADVQPPHRLLVAVDFSEPSRRALELAHRLRAGLHAAVEVAYVLVDPFADRGGAPPESIWASEKELLAYEEGVRKELAGEVERVFGPEAQAVVQHVVRGTPVTELLALAEERGSDLLLVGTTGKSGVERALLGSVSLALVRRSKVPVVTVP